MAAQPRIVVRKAEGADYEAVMDITKEFALGADYLFEQYNELVNDPDSTYYVCEVNGEVPLVQDSLAEEIQTIQSKMASLGANDGIEALERAVFTTSGRMMYRQAASYLPSDPSYGCVSVSAFVQPVCCGRLEAARNESRKKKQTKKSNELS